MADWLRLHIAAFDLNLRLPWPHLSNPQQGYSYRSGAVACIKFGPLDLALGCILKSIFAEPTYLPSAFVYWGWEDMSLLNTGSGDHRHPEAKSG